MVSTPETRANCAIDYGGFVEPVTDRIIGLACNIALPDRLAQLCGRIIGELKNKTLSLWGWRSRLMILPTILDRVEDLILQLHGGP